ncbi:Transcription factor [Niveomyces insectorum RCEF 264]|uniref:Transcription factor n=1 Tax=Niveomyces insectorum RCEF 264 TaxID=1081102 RepID=A0A167P6E3_9HYPO|nr:Transcription factor [Niveomyces insectorum RCEF 264]
MKPSLQCAYCERRFSRPSHLDRHRLTHLPPSRRHALPCGHCGKTFGRNDVLLRHLRSAHQIDPGPRTTTQRSCSRCVQKRRKCDRGRPCRSCADASEVCMYAVGAAEKQDANAARAAALSPASPVVGEDGAFGTCSSSAGGTTAGMHNASSIPRSDFPEGLQTVATTSVLPTAAPVEGPHTHEPFYGSGYDTEFDSVVPGAATAAFWAVTEDSTSSCSFRTPANAGQHSPPFSDGDFGLPSSDANNPLGASLSAVGQLDFRAPGLDWLDFDVPDLVDSHPETGNGLYSEADESGCNNNNSNPNVVEPLATASTSHALVLPAALGRHATTVLPWPFDQTQDATSHRFSLPPLRDVLHSSLASDGPILNSTLQSVVSLMSDTRLPSLDDAGDPNSAHAANLLKRLVDVYFAEFHDILPLLHVPTWSMSGCSTALVAAMACIGALLSKDDHAGELAWSMSEICMPVIAWLGSSDSANYRDISFLSALCLHQIYSLGSGHRQLYQNADRSRGILVGSLRGVGCLTTRLSVAEQLHDATNIHSNGSTNTFGVAKPSSAQDEWTAWIGREREKRTAWASFEYDCSICTLTSRRAAVDLSELPRELPCAEALWNAPSADAWAALRTRAHPNAFGVPVSWLLKAVLTGGPIPKHVSFWSKRLCAQVIGRLLWDLKQLEIISTAEYFGMPKLAAAQKENKATLLRAMDGLLATLQQPTSTADLISFNIASLVCHYSHLFTAHDMLDIVLYLVRSAASTGSKRGKGIQVAERELQSAFARDPRQARRLVQHAAQIAAVAGDYLVSAPCEIMRVFMGYIFVIAFAKYFPRGAALPYPDGAAAARLDILPHQLQSTDAVNAWVENGGPASMGSVPDILADDAALAISCDARKMLQKLKCWGLAEKFTKILQIFESTMLVSSNQ